MNRAKVSELKARLSSYLAQVRSGETVIVCERTTPVAQLAPLEQDLEGLEIRESAKPVRQLGRIRAVRLRRDIDADELLEQLRGER